MRVRFPSLLWRMQELRASAVTEAVLPGGLTVGRETLTLQVLVRIQAGQGRTTNYSGVEDRQTGELRERQAVTLLK